MSTAEDGVIIAALTLDGGNGPQLIAGPTTGEDVFIDVGASLVLLRGQRTIPPKNIKGPLVLESPSEEPIPEMSAKTLLSE